MSLSLPASLASLPLPLLITSAVFFLFLVLVLFFRVYVSPPPLNLKGKVVVITGGSSGIGKAVAQVRKEGGREGGREGGS